MQKTALEDLPEETNYLRRYDSFRARIEAIVEMPDRTIDLLFHMLRQNEGKLSKRAREKEFARLTGDETRRVEQAYDNSFRG